MITAEELEPGVNYFCIYSTIVDPEQFPMLAGKNLPPITTMTSTGQILKRDIDARLLEIIDLDTHQRHVVGYDDVQDIAIAD